MPTKATRTRKGTAGAASSVQELPQHLIDGRERLKRYWFQPGKSGCPGGRGPGLRARIRAATKDGQDLIDLFVRVVQSDAEATRDRLQAGSLLLDRGWGKATQPLEVGRPRSERRLAVLEAISKLPQDVVSQVCAVLALAQGQDALPEEVDVAATAAGNSAPGKDIQ